jgi:hypothetical protein
LIKIQIASSSGDSSSFLAEMLFPFCLSFLKILGAVMHLKAGNAIRTRDINLGKVALYH